MGLAQDFNLRSSYRQVPPHSYPAPCHLSPPIAHPSRILSILSSTPFACSPWTPSSPNTTPLRTTSTMTRTRSCSINPQSHRWISSSRCLPSHRYTHSSTFSPRVLMLRELEILTLPTVIAHCVPPCCNGRPCQPGLPNKDCPRNYNSCFQIPGWYHRRY